MTLPPGTIASTTELKARWAYSELTSTRFGRYYRQYPLEGLDKMAEAGVGFEDIESGHRALLARVIDEVRHSAILDYHVAYQLQNWSKGRLCQATVAAHFNNDIAALPYYDFYLREPRTDENGATDQHDPRAQARSIQAGKPEPCAWGAITIYEFPGLIVDGYLRSVLFMRDADPHATLPVWVGLGPTAWRVEPTLDLRLGGYPAPQPMAGAAATQ